MAIPDERTHEVEILEELGIETTRQAGKGGLESAFLWPDRDSGPWLIRLFFEITDDRYECVGFKILHVEGTVPLTASLLRRVPLARLISEERRALAEGLLPRGERVSWNNFEHAKRLDSPRRRYSAEHWERVAAIYNEGYLLNPDAPTRYVAETLGAERTTAGKWVATCRRMGLLPATEQRIPKGNPPKGKRDGS